jgi:hypothetical protein
MVRLGRVGVVAFLCMGFAGATEASASTLTTSCSAAAANVFGSPVVVANPQQTPCTSDSVGTAAEYVPLPGPKPGFSWLSINGPSSQTYAASGSNTSTNSASTNLGGFALSYVYGTAPAYFLLSITGGASWSSAAADIGSCPATARTTGASGVADLEIDGTPYNGNQAQTIDIPGVATITVNQQVVDNGTITQRALDIKLTATNQEIAVAQSSAGATCS